MKISTAAKQLALRDGYQAWNSVDGYTQQVYLDRAKRDRWKNIASWASAFIVALLLWLAIDGAVWLVRGG